MLRKCNLDSDASDRTSDSKMLRTIYGTVQQKVSGAPQETARFMVSRTILKRVGGSHRRNGRSKKKCLMGNSITQDQLEKQEQEERTSP